jgi:hypothetical protein
MLEAGTTVRNVSVCILILLGSYVASTFVNASVVTRPRLTGPRGQMIVVSPTPEAREIPVEQPTAPPESPFTPRPDTLQTL